MWNHLESIAIFSEHWSKIVRIIDEKQHVVELIPAVQLVQKPPRRLFRRGRKQAHMKNFVRIGIDSTVQQ